MSSRSGWGRFCEAGRQGSARPTRALGGSVGLGSFFGAAVATRADAGRLHEKSRSPLAEGLSLDGWEAAARVSARGPREPAGVGLRKGERTSAGGAPGRGGGGAGGPGAPRASGAQGGYPEGEAVWARGASAPRGPAGQGTGRGRARRNTCGGGGLGLRRRQPPRMAEGWAALAYLPGRGGRGGRSERRVGRRLGGSRAERDEAARGQQCACARGRRRRGGAKAQSPPLRGALRRAARGTMPRAGPTP